MNIKFKTALIIIITLAFGIVIGAMINRAISQNRIKSILAGRNPVHFVASYERIIRPDAEQTKLIREVLDKYGKHLSEIREKSRQELQSSFESMMEELDSILTPEQRKRLEKRRFPGRPPYRPLFPSLPPGRMSVNMELLRLKERLDLSEDQASQIKQILEEAREQAKMMREEGVSWRERREVLRELEEKKDKAIEKILTADQKRLYEQMKKERSKKIEEEMRRRRRIMKKQGLPRY